MNTLLDEVTSNDQTRVNTRVNTRTNSITTGTQRPLSRASHGNTPVDHAQLTRELSQHSTRFQIKSPWWRIHLFRGMIDDVKRRAPYYLSDWTDAWDYRVIPATVYMYFANILPALAFSLDMFEKTDNSYGVNEVLLASVLGCVVFSILAAQPLVIVGVTGPITVFSYTVFDIIHNQYNFFSFMAWVGIWSAIMHWILAITNSCKALKYVTSFSCDIFGFYVAFIYLQKGIQVLTRQWLSDDPAAPWLSIVVALLLFAFAYLCGIIGASPLLHRHMRKFIDDYGTPLCLIFFTGFVYWGHMRNVKLETLPTGRAFQPTAPRTWFVDFWSTTSVGEIFTALPFGLLLTILFWFDHNVSALIAQGSEYPLRKPPGFHWDIFLLGITTLVAGFLGIPFPNGLIPQAPFHTASLCVSTDQIDPATGKTARTTSHVVEQRVSNLAQGLLFLITMTGPLLFVLHLIPSSVLAGLFFVMGAQALATNGITLKILYLLTDHTLVSPTHPLRRLPRPRMLSIFVAVELLGFAATFAITQTIAAIGFPVFIIALIPCRIWLMPRFFTAEELEVLDQPVAGDFVMESVGGVYRDERKDDEEEGVQQGCNTRPTGELIEKRA